MSEAAYAFRKVEETRLVFCFEKYLEGALGFKGDFCKVYSRKRYFDRELNSSGGNIDCGFAVVK